MYHHDRARKGCRVYAMFPHTTALYPGTVINNTMYCRGEDDIIVVEFDGDEGMFCRTTWFLIFQLKSTTSCHHFYPYLDELGEISHRHIPARFVSLMPRESPSFKRRRKSSSSGGVAKKRGSKIVSSASPSMGPSPTFTDTTVDRMLLEMLK
jgi:hypothetical protein